jgi:hypothetical protein
MTMTAMHIEANERCVRIDEAAPSWPYVTFLTTIVLALLLAVLGATRASAVVKCKAKFNPDGVIEVSGRNVGLSPRWGVHAANVTASFFNISTCLAAGKLDGCQIGDPSTIAAKRPPAGCTIYVVDATSGDPICAAFIKGCVPEALDAGGDGVVRIDQARAQAGGVTQGDTPGFPVTLSRSGSYRLTSNLDVQAEPNPIDVTAIEITAEDGVTLDFNGFMIEGPVGCTIFGQLICAPAGGSGRGVDAHGASNVTVRNGTVEGMQEGLVLGGEAHVEGMTVWFNASTGISVGGGSILRGNVVRTSIPGVICPGLCVFVNNMVALTGGAGIRTAGFGPGGSTLIGNTISAVQGTGLDLAAEDGFANNVINNNTTNVSGGVEMGDNVCDGSLACP